MLWKLKNEGFVIQDFNKVLLSILVYHFVNRLFWATDDKIHYWLMGWGGGGGVRKYAVQKVVDQSIFLSKSRLIVMLKLVTEFKIKAKSCKFVKWAVFCLILNMCIYRISLYISCKAKWSQLETKVCMMLVFNDIFGLSLDTGCIRRKWINGTTLYGAVGYCGELWNFLLDKKDSGSGDILE